MNAANRSMDQINFLAVLAEGCPQGLHFLVAQKVDWTDASGPRTGFPAEEWREQYLKGVWYFSAAASEGKKSRKAQHLKAVRAIVIDDVGTKVDAAKLLAPPTWKLETSPGNEQWGYMLEEWSTDIHGGDELFAGLVAAKLQDPGVRTCGRLFRVPDSLNDKPGMDGFRAKLHHFDRDIVYTLESLAKALKVKPGKLPHKRSIDPDARPAAGAPDPVFDWLAERGDVKREATGGWFDVRCPWEDEHTAERPDGCRLLPLWNSPDGSTGIMCQHGHNNIGHKVFRRNYIAWVKAEGGPDWPVPREHGLEAFQKALLRRHIQKHKLVPSRPGVTVPTTKHDDPLPDDLYTFGTLREALGTLELSKLPHVEMTNDGNVKQVQPSSFENVEAGLEQLGVLPRLNLMNARTSFILPERIEMRRFGTKDEHEIADMVEGALLDIFGRARMRARKDVKECTDRIANSTFWHPMRDWIMSKPWDGKDRFEALLGTLDTPTPDLWRIYFRRWALQTIEASCGWTVRRKSQKGLVLVLVGAQRIGKSRWLMALAPDFAKTGKHLNLNGGNARDSIHQSLQAAITELGELDATFRKSDISALKAFVTEDTDEYRLPYAAVWLRRPRTTSFCGSVNEKRFLNDPTGSGRFLGIEVTGRPQVDHAVDMQQFWAQVHAWWQAGEQWWLTLEEAKLRDDNAGEFQSIDAVQEVLEESLAAREDADAYPVRCIVGPRAMLDLCKCDSILAKNLSTASRVLTDSLGKGRDLTRQGATTKHGRWVVNCTGSEQVNFKLVVAKPART